MPRQLWKAFSASGLSLATVIAESEEEARERAHRRFSILEDCPISRANYRKWVEDGEQVEIWKDPSDRRSR